MTNGKDKKPAPKRKPRKTTRRTPTNPTPAPTKGNGGNGDGNHRSHQWTPSVIATGLLGLAALVAAILFGVAALNGEFSSDSDNNASAVANANANANGGKGVDSSAPSPTAAVLGTGTMPNLPNDGTNGNGWTVKLADSAVDKHDDVNGWPSGDGMVGRVLGRLCAPKPAEWDVFPNVPNPKATSCTFNVANGMEYGMAESPYCENHPCDMQVSAQHYRLMTGDYKFLNTSCQGDGTKGCMLVLVNVMDADYIWRNQDVDNGFTVAGRYFVGENLDQGLWGLVSEGSASMLNMAVMRNPLTGNVLDSGTGTNGGSNCGHPQGCKTVDVTVVIHAGDRIIATAHATVSHP